MTEGPKQMTEKQAEAEIKFRSSLQDVAAVARSLAPYCRGIEELVGMVELALDNSGQLRMLMERVLAGQKR